MRRSASQILGPEVTLQAFTRMELMLTLLCIAILTSTASTILSKQQSRSVQTQCKNNLAALATSTQMWFHDYEDRSSWSVLPAQGGSHGRAKASEHFAVMSNYLGTPKMLTCPGLEKYRPQSQNFAHLEDRNVCYAIALDVRVLMSQAPEPQPWDLQYLDFDLEVDGRAPNVGRCARAGGILVSSFDTLSGAPSRIHANFSKTNHLQTPEVLARLGGPKASKEFSGEKLSVSIDDSGGSVHILKPE